MLSLGIDLGSSSIKVSIYDHKLGKGIGSGYYPEVEMEMIALRKGWAEQEPEWWWLAFKKAYWKAVKQAGIDTTHIQSIGIAYQMHGLVCLDKDGQPLRPSIIWCDSRAVDIGQKALDDLGKDYAFNHLLNSPGNFTASKLRWVKEKEPALFEKIDKICLPGDYLALKLTGELSTTVSGMSEGIFYDFKGKSISKALLDYYGFSENLLPPIRNSFDVHGKITRFVAEEFGLSREAKVTYKAGDQPNNALSLNVLNPGELAATAGTSGVIYGVSDKLFIDYSQRVNSFAHVNYEVAQPRIGILLCINGTGIANSWAKKWTRAASYALMNERADKIALGSEGLFFLPFGNGSERMLENKTIDSQLLGINFNAHTPAHLYRAVQEGIAGSFIYGMEAFAENEIALNIIRAGHANLFLSPLFGQLLSTLSGVAIELYNTDGSLGAARAALVGAKKVALTDAFENLQKIHTYVPDKQLTGFYSEWYQNWKNHLKTLLT